MASFVEAAVTAVRNALVADATILGLVGAATQVRRANQKGQTEPPCIIIEPTDHDLPVASADELREVALTLHCYATNDLTASEIADAAVSLLNESTSLSATGYTIDMGFIRGRFGAPVWSPREQAMRCDVWLYLNMRATT